MRLALESLSAGAVTVVVLGFAVWVWRQIGFRPSLDYAVRALRRISGRFTATVDRGDHRRPEPDRVVRSHQVLSGRLMDSPTGRLWPSERHRVPPWVASSRDTSP